VTRHGWLAIGAGLGALAMFGHAVWTSSSHGTPMHSLDDPASPWVIVNKARALNADYVPQNLTVPAVPFPPGTSERPTLRRDAARALEVLMISASQAGARLMLLDGYRSYSEQAHVYERSLARQGVATAERFVARAGHSEHQTGLAADMGRIDRRCELDRCFARTPEGEWLARNAYHYGFVIRYQAGHEQITGYEHEPWHLRYVGKELAAQVRSTGVSLERYFGLPFQPQHVTTLR
jgi:D-alanyl-D-alanine carboxypeptidase